MTGKNRLELTWIEKDRRPRLEPRILLEDASHSHCAEVKRDGDIFDNIVIHGDNLLALKALESGYSGQVKCIYIDPPFNTGSAFEHYDDGLEHSVWLGLMRDRFQIMKNLLTDDGVLFVQLDDNESAYCKILLDEIFGRSNYVNQLVVATNKPFGFKGTSEGIFKQANHILFYAKSRANLKLAKSAMFIEKAYDPQYKWVFDDLERPESERSWKNISEIVAAKMGYSEARIARKDAKEEFDAAIATYAIENASRVFRTASVSGGAYNKRKTTIEKSKGLKDKIIRHPDDDMDYMFIGGERVLFYSERLQEIDGQVLPAEVITDIWTDIAVEGLASEGGVSFPKGKKPEKLIQRIIALTTTKGDLVLDSFAGSGTTAAVSHKMGRRWITVELGNHAVTHVVPRLKRVIEGSDKSGITASENWQGGGGFRYFRLAPSLLEMDQFGNWVISKAYNAEMLSEAMCKHFGFSYSPSEDQYWMHGHSSESDFIYVTTASLTHEQLRTISDEVGNERTLLICCKAFQSTEAADFKNLTIRKIPAAVLGKCEWGKDDYSLKVENLPMMANEGSTEVQSDLFSGAK